MRRIFEKTAYTTLVPHFLAYLHDPDEFSRLHELDQPGKPSGLMPLLRSALGAGVSSRGWGSCAIYFDKFAEIYPVQCYASDRHCVALGHIGLVDISYYSQELAQSQTPWQSSPLLEDTNTVFTWFEDGKVFRRTLRTDSSGLERNIWSS